MSVAECLPEERGKRLSPYAHAPRLPIGERIALSDVFAALPSAAAPGADGFELEIGPGHGHFIYERAAQAEDICIIGLEIKLKWATLVDERLKRLGYAHRARVFAEDIRFALPRFPEASASRVFVHFPDPWWKKRHAKRRLASGGVIEQLARLLRPGGELFVQTDVWETARAYREAIEGHVAFTPAGDVEGSPELAENPYAARSPRERRVMADGMPITRVRYRRLEGGRVA